jgi:GNAT superfamily N-acetyltransferase
MTHSDFWMKFEFESLLQDNTAEPEYFITSIRGKSFRVTEDERYIVTGRVLALWVRIGDALERGCPLESIFDSHDQELANCYAQIFNPETGSLDESLSEGSFFGNGDDLLLISKVEVLPKYRGKGLGLKIVRKTLQSFGAGKAAAVLTAQPLHQSCGRPSWAKKMQLEELEQKADDGALKLRKHWSKLGFKQVRDTDFFLLDLACRIPQISSGKKKK